MAAAAMVLSACGADQVTSSEPATATPRLTTFSATNPQVVISQVYGGGGNSGATLRSDFIELHNRGNTAVSVAGWSVQYASATGSTWNKTDLTGSIPAGGYYLIKQADGSNTLASALPTPDASGSITMSATTGKVVLVSNTTQQTGSCPIGVSIIDRVGFGSTANCVSGWGANTAAPSNTNAVLRKDGGCLYTGVPGNDFVAAAPLPRNTSTAPLVCGTAPEPGPVDEVTVSPSTGTVAMNTTLQLTATARDTADVTVPSATFVWSTSDANIATVSTSGLVTGVTPGVVTITATSNGFTGTATITVPEPATLPPVRISELHYDNDGLDFWEFVEVEAPAGTDLTGWRVVLYNGNGGAAYDTKLLTGLVPATCGQRGVVTVDYPINTVQNGAPDGLALVNAAGTVIEFLSYEGSFTATDGPASGMQSRNILASQNNSTPVGTTLQRSNVDTWALAADNYGGCNGRTEKVVREPVATFSFSGREADEALPVGFQDQLFANYAENGVPVSTTFTWSSDTPSIATVDSRGVVTGTGAGTAVIRATAANGKSGTFSLPIFLATPWSDPKYGNHVEFGAPTDGDLSDEVLISRMEYRSSFSRTRNIPNWVAYNLEASHIVSGQDRCDCFTFDPELIAAGLTPYTTADYTGAGTVAGFGIDRGHLVRSFDRTAGSLDNARTFYFSNIIPQTADNNQGPWARLENALGDSARVGGREVYIIAGASGNAGTIKNEGRITIPEYVWKVAVIMPKDKGLGDFVTPSSATVIAVVMPNVAGIRNVAWEQYATTVDAVEALSGYDVLSLLNDQVEIAVESNTKAPVARVNGPFEIFAGESVTLSAEGSTDADAGDVLTYGWNYGDGRTGTGLKNTVMYNTPGMYTATVTVTDQRTLFGTAQTTVKVLSSAEGLAKAAAQVTALGTIGKLNRGVANSLAVKLRNAGASIDRNNPQASAGQIGALLNEMDALVKSGRLKAADAEPAVLTLQRVLASLAYGL